MSELRASAGPVPRLGRATGLARGRTPSRIGLWAAGAFVAANTALIVALWWRGGNVTEVGSAAELLVSIGRLTGLLGAFAALVQVLLLARIPWVERAVGLDRLTAWHRWNGLACFSLVLAHVACVVWGYSLLDRLPLTEEISLLLTGGIYMGMVTATLGAALLVAVTLSSIAVARRHVRYEAWYAIHLMAYAAIGLAWFHQIPTGNELVLDRLAANWWRGLYLVTIALLVGYRLLVPAVNAVRYRLRVAEVVDEGAGTVSLRIDGRRLDRLHAHGGQFFLWRFLTRGGWWAAHPFSLSAAPDGRSLRITIKSLGDFTSHAGEIPVGTRVLAEGPFGVFTDAVRRRPKVALIGGGVGIAPIRSLLEETDADAVVVYRVIEADDVILGGELRELAERKGAALHIVVGDHRTEEGRELLSPEHLQSLVPDLAERDVYVCGPSGMTDCARRSLGAAHVPSRHIHTERFAL